jgi:hypothetical protein
LTPTGRLEKRTSGLISFASRPKDASHDRPHPMRWILTLDGNSRASKHADHVLLNSMEVNEGYRATWRVFFS